MSSLIIENILQKKEKLNFDFSKSIKENNDNFSKNYDNILPISINDQKNSWEHMHHDGFEKLYKVYNFSLYKHMLYFLNEYISIIAKYNKVLDFVVKEDNVKIILYTQDYNQVTDLDLQISKFLDDISDDINFIKEQ
jgi:pterin-4a-carbinolamine dehydratase